MLRPSAKVPIVAIVSLKIRVGGGVGCKGDSRMRSGSNIGEIWSSTGPKDKDFPTPTLLSGQKKSGEAAVAAGEVCIKHQARDTGTVLCPNPNLF